MCTHILFPPHWDEGEYSSVMRRCDVTLYDYRSPEQLSRLCWCVVVVVVVVCIVMLHRVIIICNNCPICNAGARPRLAAKWYWPIAPNSTRLTRTHHLSPGYWLQNIFMFNSKLKYLRTFWTKSISLHEWNMLIVIAITRVCVIRNPEDVAMPWLIFNLRRWVQVQTHPRQIKQPSN